MKLFYKVSPDNYRACMDQIREKFSMHEEVDEARTILMLDDDTQIERVMGTFDPNSDSFAHVRVNLNDESLRDFFDTVLGQPYKMKR